MANGILIVDKPADWTSQDVVSKLRGVFHEKRVGHGGTLDPMATGVLPVFFGRATRAVEFFEHAEKAYVAHLRLGTVTDTQDTTGNVLETHPVTVSEEQIRSVLAQFLGQQEQIPPMYSAIKVGGKKLYELARAGKEVERKPRAITVFELELRAFSEGKAVIYVRCSKGTYVRTLCHDIGAALGCGGCMSSLRRTKSGVFSVDNAYTIAEIQEAADRGEEEKLMLPIDTLFAGYTKLSVDADSEKKLKNGCIINTSSPDGRFRVYSEDGEFLLLGDVKDGVMKTVKNFFEV